MNDEVKRTLAELETAFVFERHARRCGDTAKIGKGVLAVRNRLAAHKKALISPARESEGLTEETANPASDKLTAILGGLCAMISDIDKYANDTYWCGPVETVCDRLEFLIDQARGGEGAKARVLSCAECGDAGVTGLRNGEGARCIGPCPDCSEGEG